MRTVFPALALLALGCPHPDDRPQPEALDCAEGFHVDGEICVPEACGTGTWGDLLVDEAAIYVDAAAQDGGDGSAEAPLRAIQPALDLAGSRGGGLVAVAAGTYSETLLLGMDHSGVHLAGRCRELVTLDASGGDENTPGIRTLAAYGYVKVSGLTISNSISYGIRALSGTAALVDLRVVGSAHGGIGASKLLETPTVLSVSGCELTDNAGSGIEVWQPGTTVMLEDTIVRGTLPHGTGGYGDGIHVSDGAALTALRCDIAANTRAGIACLEMGTEVLLVDTSVRDTVQPGSGYYGDGVWVQSGAALSAVGCNISGNSEAAFWIEDRATEVSLVDTRIRDTLSSEADGWGNGIFIREGSKLSVEGCELAGNRVEGIFATGSGTEVALTDTTIRGTLPDSSGCFGQGIVLSGGASLSAVCCELVGNSMAGIEAWDAGTEATLVNVIIRDTQPDAYGRYGFGAGVMEGAKLSATGCELTDNTMIGTLATGTSAELTLADTSITGTATVWGAQGAVSNGVITVFGATTLATGLLVQDTAGPGLYAVGQGSRLVCTDCYLIDNHFAGAAAIDSATLELHSSTIAGTEESADIGGGVGVFAAQQEDYGAPTLRLSDSRLFDNLVAGVWVAGEGDYQLSDNTLTGSSGVSHGTSVRCGDGVYARDVAAREGSSGLSLVGNDITDNNGAGLFLDDAWATLDGNTWQANDPDLLVQDDACLSPREDYAEAPTSEICPTWDQPTCDLLLALSLSVAQLDARMPPPPTAPTAAMRPERSRLAGAHAGLNDVLPSR